MGNKVPVRYSSANSHKKVVEKSVPVISRGSLPK